MSQDTPYVVHTDDVPEQECRYEPPFDGELLAFGRNLGKAAGSVKVGLWHERIPPGHRTSFTHAHSHEEELAYVISGVCMLRVVEPGQEPREIPLRAGHVASFPAGTGIAHTFVNRSDEDCKLVCFGERREGDGCIYPEDTEYDAHRARNDPSRHWAR